MNVWPACPKYFCYTFTLLPIFLYDFSGPKIGPNKRKLSKTLISISEFYHKILGSFSEINNRKHSSLPFCTFPKNEMLLIRKHIFAITSNHMNKVKLYPSMRLFNFNMRQQCFYILCAYAHFLLLGACQPTHDAMLSENFQKFDTDTGFL